jgi:putative flippase GtrA
MRARSPPVSERARFIRFLVAAGLSVPVNLASRVALSHVVPFEAAIVLSHLLGMATAWILTRLFVFEPSGRSASSELSRFALVNLVSVTQTWIVSVGLLRLVFPLVGFDRQPELVAHAAGLASSALTSFWGHRAFSFAKPRERHAES